jgi:outer membrane protein TolC
VIQAYNQNLPLREAGFRVLAARASYNIKVGGLFPQGQSALATYNRYQLSNNVAALNNLSTTAFSIWVNGT